MRCMMELDGMEGLKNRDFARLWVASSFPGQWNRAFKHRIILPVTPRELSVDTISIMDDKAGIHCAVWTFVRYHVGR